jgi:hypothetical protein
MKIAGRENPNHGVAVPRNQAHGAVGQNRSCSIEWATKQEKFRPRERCFFLTSTFIQLLRRNAGPRQLGHLLVIKLHGFTWIPSTLQIGIRPSGLTSRRVNVGQRGRTNLQLAPHSDNCSEQRPDACGHCHGQRTPESDTYCAHRHSSATYMCSQPA